MLRRLRRATIERGLLGGSVPWIAAGLLVWGLHGLRIALRRETGVIWQGTLRDGESLVIGQRRQ